ncbi:MAG TPA: hypothetical protein VN962_06740 [Polyangia bacterium]|nr:hypothetical protein [Polyangia bacterium]
MKLAHIIEQTGKKAFFGVVFLLAGFVGLAATGAEKAPSVVTLTLGIYAALVTGHVVTDAKAITALKKTETEESS